MKRFLPFLVRAFRGEQDRDIGVFNVAFGVMAAGFHQFVETINPRNDPGMLLSRASAG